MIVGGTPRSVTLQNLTKKVGGDWEWIEARKHRLIYSLVHKLNTGKLDRLIILNRFVSHSLIEIVTNNVHPDARSRIHFLEKGYGLREIMEVLG
jgi:hypothetical protein